MRPIRWPARVVFVGEGRLARRIDDVLAGERDLYLASHCTTVAQACEVAGEQPIDIVLVEASYAHAAPEDLHDALRTHGITVLVVADTEGLASAIHAALRQTGSPPQRLIG